MTNSSPIQFRSLFLLLPITSAPGEEVTSPASLWQWVVDNHVLTLEHVNSQSSRTTLLKLLGTLRFANDLDFLQACFAKQATPNLARQLHLRGDRTGVEHYRQALPGLKEMHRFSALRFLVGVGDSDAMRDLINLAKTRTDFVSGYRRGQALSVLAAFLQTSRSENDKQSVLEFFVEEAENARGRNPQIAQVFRALEAEAGTDFGYPAARSTNDPAEQKRALRKATEDARAWLASRQKGR